MTERESLIILNAVHGLTNRRILKLIQHFGSAKSAVTADQDALTHSGILPHKAVECLTSFDVDGFLKNELDVARKESVQILTHLDDNYPPRLREIADAPCVLYVKGNVDVLAHDSIAIVGSRRSSIYGMTTAREFGMKLAQAGFNIVSGLAIGVDTAAHQGALTVDGITVGVLGCGLSVDYPAQNTSLRREMTRRGAVVSEFPMSTGPVAYNFPRRNRIISGLSDKTVVIEAASKSGALITADFALEQGRDVCAVPGKIDSPFAQGTNDLIKQGAQMVTSVDDITGSMVSSTVDQDNASGENLSKLSGDEQAVYGMLSQTPRQYDELMNRADIEPHAFNRAISALEIKRLVKQLPGKYFRK